MSHPKVKQAKIIRSKPPRPCIFCGQSGVSREHIWPDWAAEYFPAVTGAREVRFKTLGKTGLLAEPPHDKTRQGRVISKTLRVVCTECNNRWMSALEEAAKPALLSLILPGESIIGLDDQAVIARWMALKAMVCDQSVPEDVVFHQSERTAFLRDRTMPPNFEVWIARCGASDWRHAYCRNVAQLALPPLRFNPPRRKNVQTFTLGFGELLLVAAHGLGPLRITFNFDQRRVFRIWPITGPITWPPPRVSANDAFSMANAIDDVLYSDRTRWIP